MKLTKLIVILSLLSAMLSACNHVTVTLPSSGCNHTPCTSQPNYGGIDIH
jgi:hypothetical protein